MFRKLGVTVHENFITFAEEKALLGLVDRIPGSDRPKGPARMFRFGKLTLTEDIVKDRLGKEHGYKSQMRRSYGEMNDGIDVSFEDVPKVLETIGQRLVDMKILNKLPPIYVFNKYLKGQGIARHIDHFDNGPVIPVIGLKSNARMKLTSGDERIVFDFPARALVTLEDAARYEWYHEVLPCKAERYALVFRNLPD